VSVETREYCDLCDRDLTFVRGGMSIYRGKFRSFWHWDGKNEPRGHVTICGPCWNRLAADVREARVASNQNDAPTSRQEAT
jgi:hypothetical protein